MVVVSHLLTMLYIFYDISQYSSTCVLELEGTPLSTKRVWLCLIVCSGSKKYIVLDISSLYLYVEVYVHAVGIQGYPDSHFPQICG